MNSVQTGAHGLLRPLTVSQAITGAFGLYRKLPVSFWVWLLAVTIPLVALGTLVSEPANRSLDQAAAQLYALTANGTAALSALSPDQLTTFISNVLGPASVLIGVSLVSVIIRVDVNNLRMATGPVWHSRCGNRGRARKMVDTGNRPGSVLWAAGCPDCRTRVYPLCLRPCLWIISIHLYCAWLADYAGIDAGTHRGYPGNGACLAVGQSPFLAARNGARRVNCV